MSCYSDARSDAAVTSEELLQLRVKSCCSYEWKVAAVKSEGLLQLRSEDLLQWLVKSCCSDGRRNSVQTRKSFCRDELRSRCFSMEHTVLPETVHKYLHSTAYTTPRINFMNAIYFIYLSTQIVIIACT